MRHPHLPRKFIFVFLRTLVLHCNKNRHVPKVQWLHSFSAGVDNVCALPIVKSRVDMPLTNAKGAFSQSLAEATMFGCMYFAKRLCLAQTQRKTKTWNKFMVDMVDKKTMCIWGLGSIGEHVARMAKHGFNMELIGVKRNPAAASDEMKELCQEISDGSNSEEAQLNYYCCF